jgi:hypothetical protein
MLASPAKRRSQEAFRSNYGRWMKPAVSSRPSTEEAELADTTAIQSAVTIRSLVKFSVLDHSMSALEFEIVEWLGVALDDEIEASTFASLKILAGPERVPLTEVEDTIARTVRSHIRIPVYSVARWLLLNWWRLRWEPRPDNPSGDWIRAHSMAAIGGDYAWPSLQFSSDGEFIQVHLLGETTADVSAIRYLRDINLEIPAVQFERAVERLLNLVEGRVSEFLPRERVLKELRVELHEERTNPAIAKACKFQALAGKDPGTASPAWLSEAEEIAKQAGPVAGDEVMAALPYLRNGLRDAELAIDSMRTSSTLVKIDLPVAQTSDSVELPWEKGARLASDLRNKIGVTGVFSNHALEQLLTIECTASAEHQLE